MSYTNPDPSTYSAPPLDPAPAARSNDTYGWRGEVPNPGQYQPYGPPTPGYYAGPMAPATSGYAIASLICSILGYLGILGFGPILGIIFGHLALREIDRSEGKLQGRGLAQAGLILGYIALGLVAVVIVIIIIALLLGAGAALIAPQR